MSVRSTSLTEYDLSKTSVFQEDGSRVVIGRLSPFGIARTNLANGFGALGVFALEWAARQPRRVVSRVTSSPMAVKGPVSLYALYRAVSPCARWVAVFSRPRVLAKAPPAPLS